MIPREDKYKAKSLIDTFVYRGGDQIGAWSYTGLLWLGASRSAIAWSAVPLSAAWLLLAIWLGRRQAALAERRAARVCSRYARSPAARETTRVRWGESPLARRGHDVETRRVMGNTRPTLVDGEIAPNEMGRPAGGALLSRRAALAMLAAAASRAAAPRAGMLAAGASVVGAPAIEAAQPILTRPVPATGEPLPAIGLGTWRTFDVGPSTTDRAPLAQVLERFVALGGRVVDSSPMYGAAETVVGDLAAQLGLQPSLFLATKVWTSGREAGLAQMERSLRSLRVARLDLMQVHNLLDWRTHLRTLRQWKDAGRLRYLGVTHHVASAHDELERVLRTEPMDFVQLNYSLAEREAERRLLPLARDRGVAVLVNRPFAEGAIFRRVRGRPLPPWAADLGCASFGQLFLKWILGHPAVTCVIPATSKPEHLADNMAAGAGPLPDPATRNRVAVYFTAL